MPPSMQVGLRGSRSPRVRARRGVAASHGRRVTNSTLQLKLDEMGRQLRTIQGCLREDPAQDRGKIREDLKALQRLLDETRQVVAAFPARAAPVPADTGILDGPSTPSTGIASNVSLHARSEGGSVLVRILGAEQECRWVNAAWIEFAGPPMEAFLGKGWLENVHPKDRARCARIFRKAFLSSRLYAMEFRLARKTGEYGWLLEIGAPHLDAEGTVDGYVTTAIEISQHKNAEQNVRLYQLRLRTLMADLLLIEEHERRGLARDLHDGLSQTIALTQIKLSALRLSVPRKVRESVDEIQVLIQQTNRAARSISFELSPPILHDLGLQPAVQWLVENIHQRYGVDVLLEDDGRPKPADERTRVILFRSIRELLINAAKHARARRIRVCLRREDDEVDAVVEDDGVGMTSDVENIEGSGLLSIRERIRHVGGSMSIHSEAGRGTRVRLRAPIETGDPGTFEVAK